MKPILTTVGSSGVLNVNTISWFQNTITMDIDSTDIRNTLFLHELQDMLVALPD